MTNEPCKQALNWSRENSYAFYFNSEPERPHCDARKVEAWEARALARCTNTVGELAGAWLYAPYSTAEPSQRSSSFSWSALVVAVILHVVAINVGIGMGYHRLLTHRGYQVPRWVEYFLATCATLSSGRWADLVWVATHRIHHQTHRPRRAIRILRATAGGGRTCGVDHPWSKAATCATPRCSPSMLPI